MFRLLKTERAATLERTQRPVLLHLAVFGTYMLFGLFFTWPLLLNFGTTVPGYDYDIWQGLWNFQWFKDALLSGRNPYYTDRLFFPEGTSLFFHTLSPTTSLLGLPFAIFSPIVAYNTMLLLSFGLSGYGVWLFGRYLTGDGLAGYVAGFIFTFAPYHLSQSLGHLYLASTQWVILYLYFLWRAVDDLTTENGGFRLRFSLPAALFFVVNLFNDWYYTFFLVVLTGLIWLWFALTRRKRFWTSFALVVGIGLIGAVCVYPLLTSMLTVARRAPEIASPKETSIEFSADLMAYLVPSALHPLWRNELTRELPIYTTDALTERVVFFGYVTWFLALLALFIRPRATAFWGAIGLTALILSLGPELQFNGRFAEGQRLWLPFDLLNATPLGGVLRVPARFGFITLLAGVIMATFGLTDLLARLRPRLRWVAVAGLLVLITLEFWTPPFLMGNATYPAVYRQIAPDKTSQALIDIPFQKTSFDLPRRMYYQLIHGKRIVGGYISRDESNPTPPKNLPGVRQLMLNDTAPDIFYDESATAARLFFNFYRVGYVVVDKKEASPAIVEATPQMVNLLFGAVEVSRDDWADSYRIATGDANLLNAQTQPLMIPGAYWYEIEKNDAGAYRWLGKEGRLLALVPDSPVRQKLRLRLTGQAFNRAQTLVLQVGSRELARLTVQPTGGDYVSGEFELPPGENRLRLVLLGEPLTPKALDPKSDDERQLSVLVYKLRIAP